MGEWDRNKVTHEYSIPKARIQVHRTERLDTVEDQVEKRKYEEKDESELREL